MTKSDPSITIDNLRRHSNQLIDLLVDVGSITKIEACTKLDWPAGRFDGALRFAREQICPQLELTIPAATPPKWLYRITDEWAEVEVGASYTLGHIDSRLTNILRDVDTVLPHLTRGTRDWRRANFLSKRLAHLLSTLAEIDHSG
jgi:hypothetical protein